jgi:hypothetical protein
VSQVAPSSRHRQAPAWQIVEQHSLPSRHAALRTPQAGTVVVDVVDVVGIGGSVVLVLVLVGTPATVVVVAVASMQHATSDSA